MFTRYHVGIIEIIENEEFVFEQIVDKEKSVSDEGFWTLDENSIK